MASRQVLARIEAALIAATRASPATIASSVQRSGRSVMHGQRLPSTSTCVGATGSASSARRIASMRRLQNIEAVDLVAIGPADRPGERARADDRRQPRALGARERLGVRKPADAPARVEDHGRGHHRPGERPAARLIDSRDAREVMHRARARTGVRCGAGRAARALEDRVGGARRAAAAQLAMNGGELAAAARRTRARSSSSRQAAPSASAAPVTCS